MLSNCNQVSIEDRDIAIYKLYNIFYLPPKELNKLCSKYYVEELYAHQFLTCRLNNGTIVDSIGIKHIVIYHLVSPTRLYRAEKNNNGRLKLLISYRIARAEYNIAPVALVKIIPRSEVNSNEDKRP